MARPPKDDRLKLSTDIRIPVTAAQKRVIADAISDEPGGMATWARHILMQAAQEKIVARQVGSTMSTTTQPPLSSPAPINHHGETAQTDPTPPEIAGNDELGPGAQARENLGQDGDRAEILDFLSEVYRLNQEGSNHLAIDAILGFFDDALRDGNLARCRETLREIEPGKLSASMMKTVLVITGKAKAWLPERAAFFDRAMDTLAAARGRQDAERLLNKHV
jgi:hypothetical protein